MTQKKYNHSLIGRQLHIITQIAEHNLISTVLWKKNITLEKCNYVRHNCLVY